MESAFPYPPTPDVLQWLSGGQLANRFLRSLRLWVLLKKLYGENNWQPELPEHFSYPQLRDRLYADTHSKSDQLPTEKLIRHCRRSHCICQQTCQNLLLGTISDEWKQQIIHLTGFSNQELETYLQERPFATVHRSIRQDLKQLVSLGWLEQVKRGRFCLLPNSQLPTLPTTTTSIATENPTELSLPSDRLRELIPVLEDIAFVQPNLEVLIETFWQQLSQNANQPLSPERQTKRIFVHMDYILSDQAQDRVDTYQEQLEQLWRTAEGGVIQFSYWIAKTNKQVDIITYPVCLHYLRRAKYLSAYGLDPQGSLHWHNYRLDRISSDRLTVLPWGDPKIPQPLKRMRRRGELPQPGYVQQELEAAWGFNFYHPKAFLIMRFPADFARWYVDDTVRHPTFVKVDYRELPELIEQNIRNPQEKETIQNILRKRSSQDAYYRAWIRTNDINVLMRLRDWRPNGEAIAPLSIRKQMKAEAMAELSHYEN